MEAAAQLSAVVDFSMDVKPILSDRCFKCHGPDDGTRVEDIRFDTPEGIRASSTRIPGRILSEDPEHVMPPPESNLALTARDKAVLLRWVDQGAEYASHWAFTPPVRTDVPDPERADWARGEIDRFVLARLEREGLRPSPEADRETWLRRVTFDLTGLPPTPNEIDTFLADDAPGAYGRVVDRLMSSPAYGERMAVDWLDLARYADSHGYQDDGWRNIWPWRDWVIRAFNQNMPYDEFVTWQLAGDLMPGATRDQVLATGFNRNHLQSQEGGIVLEEFRVDYVADRTNTFGKAFLGMTMECARCHDHKYDPISQEEYYRLFAFFNSVNEVGNIPYAGEASPTVLLVDEASERRLDTLDEEIGRLERLVDPDHPSYDQEFQAWMASNDGQAPRVEPSGLVGHYPLDRFREANDRLNLDDRVDPDRPGYFWGDREKLPLVVTGVVDSALTLRGDGWLDMGGERFRFERTEPFSLGLWFRVDAPGATGALFAKSGGLFNGNRGYLCMLNADGTVSASLNHVAPDDAIEVRTIDSVSHGTWQHIVMTWDGSSRAAGLRLWLDGRRLGTRTVVDNLKQSISVTIDPTTGDSTNWGDRGNLRIGFVGSNQGILEGVTVDEFSVFDRALTAAEVRALHTAVIGSPGRSSSGEPGTAPTNEELRAFFVTTRSSLYRERFDRLTRLREEQDHILTHTPSVMVLRDLPEPRPTHVLARGAYDAPTDRVEHGTPGAVLPWDPERPSDRLGLAEWLFDPANPLTARVAVNRLWQQLFGRGIVATSDNFGSQGALPTHPDLLDWLAVTFREGGWDVQAMLRLMVLSSTYRQSSVAESRLRDRDPANELLARGPERRLTAEQMRDNALAASGLLVRQIGGPPVRPYQPDGLWQALATRNATRYHRDEGESLYRRSMYTIWKRTVPPPMMLGFDAPERNLCTVRRQSTSTPLQALVLMNDPQFVEAARVLAERLMREEGGSDADRIGFGYRLLTGRRPTMEDVARLEDLLAAELAAYRRDPGAALDLLAVGDHPRDPSLEPARLASWTVVASTLMNFDGTTMLR